MDPRDDITGNEPIGGGVSRGRADAANEAELNGVVLSTQDREALASKLESLAILAGGIAHEFNNLLMGVLGNADLALSVMSADAPGRVQVEDIVVAARRAADLAAQMLAYSGRGKFTMERVDLSTVVSDLSNLLKNRVSAPVVLQSDLGRDLPRIDLDVTQIRQAILNLVSNAAESLSGRAGLIRLTTGVARFDSDRLDSVFLSDGLEPGDLVYLEIADTGSGIEPDTMPRIFDPFFTTKFTGRGLGLATVLGIVRGHGAGLDVRSGVRRGTVVTLLFTPSPEQGAGDVPRGDLSTRGQILVIDDDSMVRAVSEAYLVKQGFAVLTAESGRAGLEAYRSHSDTIECVILDHTMPEMSGRETLEKLRALAPNVPVLFTSGYDERDVLSGLEPLAVSGFIQKPYSATALIDKLREIGVIES